MFRARSENFFTKIQKKELNDFKEKYTKGNTFVDKENGDIVDGNVLFRVPFHVNYIDHLINKLPILETEESTIDTRSTKTFVTKSAVNIQDQLSLFETVTDKIIQYKKYGTFEECLKVASEYRKELGNNFYGALLVDKSSNTIINPYHILTALSLLNEYSKNKEKLLKTFDLIIYFYKDRKKMDELYLSSCCDEEKAKTNIDMLMIAYMDRIESKYKSIKDEDDLSTFDFVRIEKLINKHKFDEDDAVHYLVANQLMTNGIFCPSYGTSLIKLGKSSTTGLGVSPMLSCNISSNTVGPDSNSFNAVCTGSLSSKTLEGLRGLNHSNYKSPFGGKYMLPGVIKYIDIMINKCEELYFNAGIINTDPANSSKEKTQTEEDAEVIVEEKIIELKDINFTSEKYINLSFSELWEKVNKLNINKNITIFDLRKEKVRQMENKNIGESNV